MFSLYFLRNLKQITQTDLKLIQYKRNFNYYKQSSCLSTLKIPTIHTTSNSSDFQTFKHNYRIKNDPDSFGDQTPEPTNPTDLQDDQHFENPPPSQRLSTKQYAEIIKKFIKKHKIKEALDVLETRMLKEDKAKPENYIYNLLLGACGRVGYTKKAFSLYNQMKKRGLAVTPGIYTALFNACANSPWPEDGLTRAKHLQNIMKEKWYEPNDTNFNAMIKAFGRCGDLNAAFGIVDEMISKNLPIKDDTINFLLQACITDKEAGFRHALLIWRKMINKKIKPSIVTYNLLLKCVRECGIGDSEVLNDTLNNILNTRQNIQIQDDKKFCGAKNTLTTYKLTDQTSTCNAFTPEMTRNYELIDETSDSHELTNHTFNNLGDHMPNLISKTPNLGNIISISEITTPQDRFLLIGGQKGFLKDMQDNSCNPDIKTVTQILDCLPGNLASEQELLRNMKKLNIKADVDFYNMLIKKRSMRFDYEGAKNVLSLMTKSKYRPDLITYGVLSLGCRSKEEALELIEEMKNLSYRYGKNIPGRNFRITSGKSRTKKVERTLLTAASQIRRQNYYTFLWFLSSVIR